jgi:hypothetical protein
MIDRIIGGLPVANIVFNTPKTLHLDNSTTIELVLSRGRPIRELKKQVTALGEKVSSKVKVSDQMKARLTGFGFKINPLTDETQPVGERTVTAWQWTVEPSKTGLLHLHLTLTALINVAGSNRTYAVKTYDRTLRIRVTWLDRVSGFVSRNWKWLWTAIAVPLLVWGFRRWQGGAQSGQPGS